MKGSKKKNTNDLETLNSWVRVLNCWQGSRNQNFLICKMGMVHLFCNMTLDCFSIIQRKIFSYFFSSYLELQTCCRLWSVNVFSGITDYWERPWVPMVFWEKHPPKSGDFLWVFFFYLIWANALVPAKWTALGGSQLPCERCWSSRGEVGTCPPGWQHVSGTVHGLKLILPIVRAISVTCSGPY